jgi:hypothetical protein
MSDEELVAELARALEEAGQAHHDAFAATGGDDPDWPRWYAEYLAGPLRERLDVDVSVEGLAAWLARADAEQRRTGDETPWPQFYARLLARQLRPPTL